MSCRICETRKPRRFCPGLHADICAPCCGAEREVSVACPLDCEYLVEARKHEKRAEVDPKDLPNQDIRVSEEFLVENEQLVGFLAQSLLAAALSTPGAVDSDLREAIAAMIQTLRTRDSGLIYETRPQNPIAGAIQQHVTTAIEHYRKSLTERTGLNSLRDASVLGSLVFLQRVALYWNNERPRGRSMITFLFERYGGSPQEAESPSLLTP